MIPRITLTVVFHAACSLAVAQPPVEVYQIDSRRELFVDATLIESLVETAELRLQHPVLQEIVLEHNEPWEGSGCVYHSIFKDDDRYGFTTQVGIST